MQVHAGEGVGILHDVVGADTGQHHDKRNENLQEAGEDESFLGLVDVLGGQSFLDDILVEAPVAEVGEPHAAHHGGDAGHVGEGIGIVALLYHEMEVYVLRVGTRGEVVKHFAQCAECVGAEHAGHLAEGHIGGDQTAAHEECHLHHIGPCHRGQTTVDGVDAGHEEESEDDEHPQGHLDAEDAHGHALQTEYLLNGKCAEPGHGGEVDEHVEEEPEDGEGQSHTVVVAFAEELGDGEYLAVEHHWQQELADDHERDGGHHLVGCDGDAVAEARARHADKLFGGDVGGDERGAHGPPCEGVAGEEVVVGGFFLAALVAAQKQSQSYQ